MLQEIFKETTARQGIARPIADPLWAEIAAAHTSAGRYYHDLNHLEYLLSLLLPLKDQLADWDALVYAVSYHDIVYDPLAKDNEEASARLAEARLKALHCPPRTIARTVAAILATKAHTADSTPDISLFLDADLGILGAPDEAYNRYALNIRKEYAAVPDLLYIPGRRQVLEHFLTMPQIYKTDRFRNAYEEQARRNIARELNGLR